MIDPKQESKIGISLVSGREGGCGGLEKTSLAHIKVQPAMEILLFTESSFMTKIYVRQWSKIYVHQWSGVLLSPIQM